MTEPSGERMLVTALMVLLASCAAPDPLSVLPEARERMTAEITDDGSKFFEFTREYMPGSLRSERRPLPEDVLTRRVDEVLLQTGYCRDGFFELYRQSVGGGLTLRGECREGASDADRASLPGDGVIFTREP